MSGRCCLRFEAKSVVSRPWNAAGSISSEPAQLSFWGPFLDNRLRATLLLGIYSPHQPLASLPLPQAYSHLPLLAIIATPGNTGSNREDSFV